MGAKKKLESSKIGLEEKIVCVYLLQCSGDDIPRRKLDFRVIEVSPSMKLFLIQYIIDGNSSFQKTATC